MKKFLLILFLLIAPFSFADEWDTTEVNRVSINKVELDSIIINNANNQYVDVSLMLVNDSVGTITPIEQFVSVRFTWPEVFGVWMTIDKTAAKSIIKNAIIAKAQTDQNLKDKLIELGWIQK